ncbi:MAG: hypothetical protein GF350_02995 [Chitinivibrionales bacterium]|nr:hypothetical protein [Chitinivibrionales bacterium]
MKCLHIACAVCMLFSACHTFIYASTQEFLGVVESGSGAGAKVKTVTVLYVSQEVSPGTIELFDPNEQCVFQINETFCTREAFLRAVTPGKRLYCRANRHVGQIYALYTTPFFKAEGTIKSFSGTTLKITHKPCYRMCTPQEETQTASIDSDMIIRYEGAEVPAGEALVPGRHVRVIAPRKQIVQAIHPDAWVRGPDELAATFRNISNEIIRASEGFFRTYHEAAYYFASIGIDGCTDMLQAGQKTFDEPFFLIDGQYAPAGAALRTGERMLFCPDEIIGPEKIYKTFVVPGDDGVIEGVVTGTGNGNVTLKVIECPTGYASDCVENQTTVDLDSDAEYHLNGIIGFGSDQTPDNTTAFRYLRFTVIEQEKGLGAGIAEMRFIQDGEEFGPGMTLSGESDAALVFDGATNEIVKWSEGSWMVLDAGDGVQTAPTGFKIYTSGSGRGLRAFRIEGAKTGSDGLTWVTLLDYHAGEGNIIPKNEWFETGIDLSNVDANPVTIDKIIKPGSYVRVLPALSNGAVLVRNNNDLQWDPVDIAEPSSRYSPRRKSSDRPDMRLYTLSGEYIGRLQDRRHDRTFSGAFIIAGEIRGKTAYIRQVGTRIGGRE